MIRALALFVSLSIAAANSLIAADLVRGVRLKLSAGDLQSAIAAAEDYRTATGVDAEYLNAVGWLARGALMLDQPELAREFAAQIQREIPVERDEVLIPFGAAIEVQSRLIARTEGRGAALEYLSGQLDRARDTALRSRISKNINLLSLEGQPAPAIDGVTLTPGKPTVLFLWAHWCGDCTAQAATLAKVRERWKSRGVEFFAVTRHYGTAAEGKKAGSEEESRHIRSVWQEKYSGLEDVPVIIDTAAMVRYGASATPTFVLIDEEGHVNTYAPTRLSETELSRRIEAMLRD